jgi:hypothetical protein
MSLSLLALRLLLRLHVEDRERGDVPGWVLITIMTAGLVTLIWGIADKQLTSILQNALNSEKSP